MSRLIMKNIFASHIIHIFIQYLADLLGIYWTEVQLTEESVKSFISCHKFPNIVSVEEQEHIAFIFSVE